MERAARRSLVEPADELAVAARDGGSVALLGGVAEAAHERLRGRAPAQVLDPLAGGLANALCCLMFGIGVNAR